MRQCVDGYASKKETPPSFNLWQRLTIKGLYWQICSEVKCKAKSGRSAVVIDFVPRKYTETIVQKLQADGFRTKDYRGEKSACFDSSIYIYW